MEQSSEDRTMVVGLIVIGLGLLAAWAVELTWSDRCLRNAGAVAQGEITDVWKRSGRNTSYHLEYRFSTPQGRLVESRESVPLSVFGSSRPGMPVAVHYCAADPSRHTLDVRRLRTSRDTYWIAFVISTLTALGFGVYSWAKRWLDDIPHPAGKPPQSYPWRASGGRGGRRQGFW